MLEAGGKQLERELTKLVRAIWENKVVPEDFRAANNVKIYKRRGDKSCCGSYRGISLLATAGKLLAKILNNRLVQIVDCLTPSPHTNQALGKTGAQLT